jgi:hypothetical protein
MNFVLVYLIIYNFIMSIPKKICLLIHCLYNNDSPKIISHPELFIHTSEVEKLFEYLKNQGYKFCLPEDSGKIEGKTCSMTFDDGYFNNQLFLPIAEKYKIPFILFVNSLNILEQKPFIWDVDYQTSSRDVILSRNYSESYKTLNTIHSSSLMSNSNHKPFSIDEFTEFSSNSFTFLGLHTHSHQILINKYHLNIYQDLELNSIFLSNYPSFLKKDLALPCGLVSKSILNRLNTLYDRIYTIDGGSSDPSVNRKKSTISRISLVNPLLNGDLVDQIVKSNTIKSKMRRKLVNFRYSF